MRRSHVVWFSLAALPSALACNLILGNETPDVSREGAVADGSASSSASSTAGGRDDAEPPLSDAAPDARDDHAELPATRLVFVDGTLGVTTADSKSQLTGYVLREDLPVWNLQESPGPATGIGAPAVFTIDDRVYVLGGMVPQDGTSVSYVSQSAPLVGDHLGPWQYTTPFPTYVPGRCTARVQAPDGSPSARSDVDVVCAIDKDRAESSMGLEAYFSVPADGGGYEWALTTYPQSAGSGVVYSTPTAIRGFASVPQEVPAEDGFAWTRLGFAPYPRGDLPAIASASEACGVFFNGHSYLMVSMGSTVHTYLQVGDTWMDLPDSAIRLPVDDLTCAATERGVYLAASNTSFVDGKRERTSRLYRALRSDDADAADGGLQAWDERVAPPPGEHPPGSVLVAVPIGHMAP